MSPVSSRRILIILLIACFMPCVSDFYAEGRKKSYKFRAVQPKKGEKLQSLTVNILDAEPDSASLSLQFPGLRLIDAESLSPQETPVFTGFDKRLNSSKESFFIINKSQSGIAGTLVCLTYRTPDGRMLTRRYVMVTIPVPAGETRKIDIPSWDIQRSFYYQKSETNPKRGNPFTVSLTPLYIIYL